MAARYISARTDAVGTRNVTENRPVVFYGGVFQITQSTTSDPLVSVDLVGGDLSGCPRRSPGYRDWAGEQRKLFGRRVPRGHAATPTAGASAKAKPRRRGGKLCRLWGSGKGRFRTKGREGQATVRGTKWLTEDRCITTHFETRRGVVDVLDNTSRVTRQLRTGQKVDAPFTRAVVVAILRGTHRGRSRSRRCDGST